MAFTRVDCSSSMRCLPVGKVLGVAARNMPLFTQAACTAQCGEVTAKHTMPRTRDQQLQRSLQLLDEDMRYTNATMSPMGPQIHNAISSRNVQGD